MKNIQYKLIGFFTSEIKHFKSSTCNTELYASFDLSLFDMTTKQAVKKEMLCMFRFSIYLRKDHCKKESAEILIDSADVILFKKCKFKNC